MKPSQIELAVLFQHHTPPPEAGSRIGHIRHILMQASEAVLSLMPECDETQLFVDKMCEAMYHANAGVAREQARLAHGITPRGTWKV